MSKIDTDSVDLVLTDPPYGIRYKSKNCSLSKRTVSGDQYPYIWWLKEADRILKADGCLLCFTRWDVLQAWIDVIRYAGLKVRSCIVWDKQHHGMGDTRAAFAPQHEFCLFATKPDFTFPAGRPCDVLRVPKLPAGQMIHPTQKPVELMMRLMEATSEPGDLIVDPFCGSGATILAAIKTQRNYIGIELDPAHWRDAVRLVEQCKSDPSSAL